MLLSLCWFRGSPQPHDYHLRYPCRYPCRRPGVHFDMLPGDGASMLTWLCTRTEPRAETLPLSEWLATASRTLSYSWRMAANRSSILPQ